MTTARLSQPLWAPWETDAVTLHLVRDVAMSEPIFGLGACARYDVRGELRGPRLNLRLARPITEYGGGWPTCGNCVAIALAEAVVNVEVAVRTAVALDIRGELVCCDAYDVYRSAKIPLPEHQAMCYWGESAARVAEGRIEEDDDRCDHGQATSWFDRELCPHPCNTMHMRCLECGEALEHCELRASVYFERHVVASLEPMSTETEET